MTQPTTASRTRAPYQWLALIVGVVYLLVGLVGFFITGFDNFIEHDHSQTLLGFAINPLHNVVHLLIGLLGVIMWSTRSRARAFGWLLLIGYGAAAIYGFIVVDNPDANILNINDADNWLHVASALVGLVIALWPDRHRATEYGDHYDTAGGRRS
jgi:ABC-type transport system involved in multi-copper enzyme maturation permease subunit